MFNLDKIYNLLTDNGYKFTPLRKENGAKFRNYGDAFNASIFLANSYKDVATGINNKFLYFGNVVKEKMEKSYNIPVVYEGIIMSFCMYLGFFSQIKMKEKISKNKYIMKFNNNGDMEVVYSEFIKENKEYLNLVDIIKKDKGLIIKRR